MDDIVGEVERDLLQRKICERYRLRIDDCVVTVLAEDCCTAIFGNGELPDLELFDGDAFVMLLRDSDNVQQPVGPALVGDVLCAVREQYRAIDAMPIPVLRACELAELNFGECCCVRHVMPLFRSEEHTSELQSLRH